MPDCPGLFTLQTVVPDYWDTLVQVAGANFTSSSLTLVDITGLTFAAAINSLYEIEIVMKVQSTDTNGIQFSVACGASGSTGEYLLMPHLTQAQGTVRVNTNVLGTANGAVTVTTANSDSIAIIKAVVTTVGNTGNITAQLKKIAGNTATIYIGSIMKIKQLA
jgi:hypothetical protein